MKHKSAAVKRLKALVDAGVVVSPTTAALLVDLADRLDQLGAGDRSDAQNTYAAVKVATELRSVEKLLGELELSQPVDVIPLTEVIKRGRPA